MWWYKEISREAFEKKKDYIEDIIKKLGAYPTKLGYETSITTYGDENNTDTIISNRTVFVYKHKFYRVSEVLFPNKPFIVIEVANTEDEVKNNTMEDADPFPYDLSDKEILHEVKLSLGSSV